MFPAVRTIFIVVTLLSSARGQLPEAREVLQTVRIAQTVQDRTVSGQLRHGARKAPFRLSMKDGQVKWEFTDAPPLTLLLRLGEKASVLEEITPDGKSKVGGVRFESAVRGTDITYEDLSLRFLYWTNATVEEEDTVMTVKCWRVLIKPPVGEKTDYAKVRVWVAQDSGALMKAEAFNTEEKLARVFTVRTGQKTADGLWILKQMRIESPAGFGGDRTPTYLELNKPD
jgi:Outer membrane lipoprotein-sorting protein